VLAPVASDLREWTMITALERIDHGVVAYYLVRGRLPVTLAEVADANLVDPSSVAVAKIRYVVAGEREFRIEALDGAGNALPGARVDGVVRAARAR
jgi:hypothetical protein